MIAASVIAGAICGTVLVAGLVVLVVGFRELLRRGVE